MVQITQYFQPPLYWQQFEDLTQAVVQNVYGAPHADKIGRPGQSQQGVDVHAGRSRVGMLGVQCKRMDDLDENNDPRPGGAITRDILLDEIAKAKTFTPGLDVWILATTAKRDARIQKVARELDAEHTNLGLSKSNYGSGMIMSPSLIPIPICSRLIMTTSSTCEARRIKTG